VGKEKGIETGDRVRVTSKRGKLEVLAVVTKRLGGLEVNGKKVYHIGIRSTGASSASRPTVIRPRAPTGSPTR
jgi:anaerobic selenocysteine-containing dehydrogenase